jgi:3-isopropylmalate/(R)-2-methylmalate dehydratase small subunit
VLGRRRGGERADRHHHRSEELTMSSVVLRLGDNVSTDAIYPGRFMATVLPAETPQFAFADDTAFNARLKAGQIRPGSIIVAGHNFGCGSSREQAASCLKGPALIVIAKDFARIFLQNAVNLGLRTIVCPTIDAREGDDLELGDAEVFNRTTGTHHATLPLPPARQAIVDAGGLIPYARTLILGQGQP